MEPKDKEPTPIFAPKGFKDLIDGLKEQLTISNTQREGYREELEAQQKVNNELAKGISKRDERIKELEAKLKVSSGKKACNCSDDQFCDGCMHKRQIDI
jgi:chromosome segregation ATPase